MMEHQLCSSHPDICCSCCKEFQEKLKDQMTLCDTIHYSWDCQLQQNREAFKEYEKALTEARRQERIKVLEKAQYRVVQVLNNYPDISVYDLERIKNEIYDEFDNLKLEAR